MSAPASPPSPAYSWYVVFVLSIGGMVALVDRGIINLLVEPIKADLGLSDTGVSLLQGFSFALFYGLMGVPLARLADRGNRIQLIAIGALIWSLATVGCGLAGSFTTLFIARMLVGVGEATLTPTGFSLVGDLFDRTRVSRASAILTASSFLGTGASLIGGGALIDWLTARGGLDLGPMGVYAPWQATFIIVAIPGLLVTLWFLSLRDPPRRAMAAMAEGSIDPNLVLPWIRANPMIVLGLYGGFTTLALVQFALGSWIPTMFVRVHGMGYGEIGAIYGPMVAVLGFLGTVGGGWLADQMMARGVRDANFRIGIGAGLLLIPFAVSFALVADQTLALWLLAPAVFLGTMPFGPGPAAIPLLAPNRIRGQLIALYLLCANLVGLAFGPTIVAALTDGVFGDPAKVNLSIAVVGAIGPLVAVAILTVCLPALRRAVAKLDDDQTATVPAS